MNYNIASQAAIEAFCKSTPPIAETVNSFGDTRKSGAVHGIDGGKAYLVVVTQNPLDEHGQPYNPRYYSSAVVLDVDGYHELREQMSEYHYGDLYRDGALIDCAERAHGAVHFMHDVSDGSVVRTPYCW